MPHPAGSQPKIRPAPDFPEVNFARRCRHEKREHSFDSRPMRYNYPRDSATTDGRR